MNYLFLALGIFIGIAIAAFLSKQKTVGTLLIDTPDPDGDPLLLLDLDGPVHTFSDERYVTVRVKKINSSSQK